MRTFKFVVERDRATGDLVGYVPGWPGAHTHGADIEELQQNLGDVLEMLLEDGERRFVSVGMDHLARVVVVVFSSRGESVRLISARRATKKECEQYAQRVRL